MGRCRLLPDGLLPVRCHQCLVSVSVGLHSGEIHRYLSSYEGSGEDHYDLSQYHSTHSSIKVCLHDGEGAKDHILLLALLPLLFLPLVGADPDQVQLCEGNRIGKIRELDKVRQTLEIYIYKIIFIP